MSDQQHDLSDLTHPPHHRAEIVFAVVSFFVAVVLALLWSSQTTWVEGRDWARQPGLWPLIAVVGMLAFGTGELIACLIRNARRGGGDVWAELGLWARSAEYVVWFLVYVWLVPRVGYLLATALFMTLLAWRLGYGRRMILMSPLVALAVVVIFKGFLSVRIPGGAVYDLFPQAVRNFLVIYL